MALCPSMPYAWLQPLIFVGHMQPSDLPNVRKLMLSVCLYQMVLLWPVFPINPARLHTYQMGP